MSTVSFKMYSGYISVGDPTLGHRLFYVLAESQNDPVNDPVVLKIGGGPGIIVLRVAPHITQKRLLSIG